MAITSAICTSYKVELGRALHNHDASTGDTFNMALYSSSATLDSTTTVYSSTNEISGTGYSALGNALTNVTWVSSGSTAYGDWADVTWSTATFTTRGCMVYNATNSNRAVFVQDFGADKSPSGGDFVVQFPTADASNAIIRLA